MGIIGVGKNKNYWGWELWIILNEAGGKKDCYFLGTPYPLGLVFRAIWVP